MAILASRLRRLLPGQVPPRFSFAARGCGVSQGLKKICVVLPCVTERSKASERQREGLFIEHKGQRMQDGVYLHVLLSVAVGETLHWVVVHCAICKSSVPGIVGRMW